MGDMWFLFCIIYFLTPANCLKIGILVDDEYVPQDLSRFDGTITTTTSVEYVTHKVDGNNVMKATNLVCSLLSQGYIGFISFVRCSDAVVLNLQSKSRTIPHIMLVQQPCYLGPNIQSFQLSSSCSEVNRAVADVVSSLRELEVFIIHDETLESRCLQDLVVRFSKISVRSRMLNTKNLSVEKIVQSTTRHDPNVIVTYIKDQLITDLLPEANSSDLLATTKNWIIIPQEAELPRITNLTAFNSKVLFIRPYYDHLHTEGLYCGMEGGSNRTIFKNLLSDAKVAYQNAIDSVITNYPSISFQPFDCKGSQKNLNGGEEIKTALSEVKLDGLTGKLGWNADKYRSESKFQICSTKDVFDTFHHMGIWTSQSGLNLENNVLFANQFTHFNGETLKIATLPAEPFVYIEEENGETKYRGFCFDILNELSKRFNFSYEMVSPADKQYGGPKDDGTWSGMVGMVKRGEVQFAIGPFTITSIRESVIDFTIPFMEDGVGILTRKITEEPNKIFKTLKPFTLQVWGAIGIVVLVVGVLLFVVNRLSPYTVDGQDVQVDTADEQKCLRENLWLIYGSFVEQAVDPRPSSNSGRVMLGCWWVFTILMTSTYTANLAAYLTVSITVQPINSLKELVAQEQIKPLVKAGTNLPVLFKNAQSGIYRQVWEKMSGMPHVTSRVAAVELTKTGKYAFMTDVSQLKFVQLQDCETLALADEVFNQAGLGFVVPENAPFKEAFNLNIMKMQEAGMTERWRDKWWPKINTCSVATRTGGAKPLDMDSIAGLFYIYVGVVGVSIVLFVFDLFCKKFILRRVEIYLSPFKKHFLRKVSVQKSLKKTLDNKCVTK